MSDQDQQVDMKKAAIAWVAGQPFNNVLLILILGSGLWACHYALTVAVPAHLKQIQEGYERIEESNSRDRNLIIQQYDKWFNTIQKRDDGDDTGHLDPSRIFDQVWSSENEHSGIFGQQIASIGDQRWNPAPAQAVEIRTPGGTVVSFSGGTNRASVSAGMHSTTRDAGRSWSGGRRGSGKSEVGTSGTFVVPVPRINYCVIY